MNYVQLEFVTVYWSVRLLLSLFTIDIENCVAPPILIVKRVAKP